MGNLNVKTIFVLCALKALARDDLFSAPVLLAGQHLPLLWRSMRVSTRHVELVGGKVELLVNRCGECAVSCCHFYVMRNLHFLLPPSSPPTSLYRRQLILEFVV